MFIAGLNVKMHYINDSSNSSIKKNHALGLTVINISKIFGGKLLKTGTQNLQYQPIGVRIEDDGRKFYTLDEGAYQVVFDQGLKKLPNDTIATILASSFCSQIGCTFVSQQYFEYEASGNLSGCLVVPSGSQVTIEIGANLADLYINFDKFQEEV